VQANGSRAWRRVAAVVVGVFLALAVRAAVAPATWEELEAQGAVIAGIEIRVVDVFDPNEPESRYWFARAANVIHIRTKREVVRRELLFKVGERVDAAKIHDSERALRTKLDAARDAVIEPERIADGKVWALVVFKDAWTLDADLHFGHVGGQSSYTVKAHERNFLGFGKGLLLSHDHTFERDIDTAAYYDPQVLGSLWTLNTNYKRLSDGRSRYLDLQRPFYTVDTPWKVEILGSDLVQTLTLYDLAHQVYAVSDRQRTAKLEAAWAYHRSGSSVFRIGAGFIARRMEYAGAITYRPGVLPPLDVQNHRLEGPELTWELFQSRNRNFTDMASIGRYESFNLGWDVTAALGYYGRFAGSSSGGPFLSVSASKGWLLGDKTLLVDSGLLQGRREDRLWRGGLLSNEFTVYNQSFARQTIAADVRLDLSLRPDPEDWLYLGGEDGLRGYPNHFRAGDRRWIATGEDRIVTPWALWGLLRVGFVGFVDLGAIHTFSAGSWGSPYSDVGFGLRFGNLKSRVSQVIEFTIAFPLVKTPETKGYEIVVGNVLRF
jgi:hypothetical protein